MRWPLHLTGTLVLSVLSAYSVALAQVTPHTGERGGRTGGPQAQSVYRVLVPASGGAASGNTAFVDPEGSRIVEIDAAARILWQWPIRLGGDLRAGADLEWVAADDSFLLVVPFSGIYRVDRSGQIRWSYRTAKVSHDADLLPNANVLFTFAWDTESDAQATEINPQGQVVWAWRAAEHVDPAWRRDRRRPEPRPSYSHANSVQRVGNDTVVSLRNMDRAVVVAPTGAIKTAYGPIGGLHDPTLRPNGSLLVARHAPPPNRVVIAGSGQHRVIFANEIALEPIRTVQPLASGHILLTGGDAIAEINRDGAVLWHVQIYSRLTRSESGVYKAVRVGG